MLLQILGLYDVPLRICEDGTRVSHDFYIWGSSWFDIFERWSGLGVREADDEHALQSENDLLM
jgi:hypothetical protein